VVVIARGDQHVMSSDLGMTPVPIKEIYAHPLRDQITVLKHGGGGEGNRIYLRLPALRSALRPAAHAMPALLCIRVRDGALILEGRR